MKRQIRFRAAIVMILLLILCAAALLIALPHYFNKGTSYTAYIYKNGQLFKTISLTDTAAETICLTGDHEDDYNVIQVISGKIGVTEASCPDQICVNQGFISNSLLPITCLPNHLVIELKTDAASSEADADAVTH